MEEGEEGVAANGKGTNKAWVIGSKEYKDKLAAIWRQRVERLAKGQPRKQVD